MRDVVIVAYGRSAVARAGKGSLKNTNPIEYSAQVLRGVLDKVPQLPYSVPGQTVNRFCASSLQAISTGANMIRSGEAEVIVAGGVESMTDIPYMGIGNPEFRNPWLDEHEPGAYMSMGITAENVAGQ